MADAAPTPAPRAKRVFVARDFENESFASELSLFKDRSRHPPGIEVDVPGFASPSGHVLEDDVLPRIRAATAVLALVDSPNANVAFEIGVALGLGRRVVLLLSDKSLRHWLDVAPFTGQLLSDKAKFQRIRELIQQAALCDELSTEHVGIRMSLPNRTPVRRPFAVLASGWQDDEAVGIVLQEQLKGHPLLRHQPATLSGLCEAVDAYDRLIWIPRPLPPKSSGLRHGADNCSSAVVAGFAFARGASLQIWLGDQRASGASAFEAFIDVRHLCAPADRWKEANDLTEPLRRLVSPAYPTPAKPRTRDELLDLIRRHHRTTHQKLVQFYKEASDRALGSVYVEIQVDAPTGRFHPEFQKVRAAEARAAGTYSSLRELLQIPDDITLGITGRWILLGDPGSGKSTVTRYLCYQLGEAGKPASEPIPIFLSVARFVASNGDPFESLHQDLKGPGVSTRDAQDAASALEALARESNQVWLLLDGFDELPEKSRGRFKQKLEDLLTRLPRMRVVVTCREAIYDTKNPPLGSTFQIAHLKPLDRSQQEQLVRALAEDAAGEVLRQIDESETLKQLATTPLLLTWISVLGLRAIRSGGTHRLPTTRAKLYRAIVQDLLLGEHRPDAGSEQANRAVTDPDSAERLLAALALELQRGNVEGRDDAAAGTSEDWEFRELVDTLGRICENDPKLARLSFAGHANASLFLKEIEAVSGLLISKGGPNERRQFPHRSIREYLAAVRLEALGSEEWKKIASNLEHLARDSNQKKKYEEELARWGEVLALLAGLEQIPVARRRSIIEVLATASPGIALRVLTSVDGLPLTEEVALFEIQPERRAEAFLQILRKHRLDGEQLRSLITSGRNLEELAVLWQELEASGTPPDRESFFAAAGRPIRSAPVWSLGTPGSALETSSVHGSSRSKKRAEAINSGRSREFSGEVICLPIDGASSATYRMGSPENVGHDNERPQTTVTLSQFWVARTAVTESQFAAILTKEEREARTEFLWENTTAEHPAIRVSWWESWIYGKWVGGNLLTEAQWEYACRGGSGAAWCFGNEERDLGKFAWYYDNSEIHTHPVALKKANRYGLFDMHGNVFEWCRDWEAQYSGSDQIDPAGPDAGADRVLRGGSYWNFAFGCRSAFRSWYRPSNRSNYIGFRVCFPAAPAG